LLVREAQNIDLYMYSWTTAANNADQQWSVEQTVGLIIFFVTQHHDFCI
jgi:hypothetical protein